MHSSNARYHCLQNLGIIRFVVVYKCNQRRETSKRRNLSFEWKIMRSLPSSSSVLTKDFKVIFHERLAYAESKKRSRVSLMLYVGNSILNEK